MCGPVRVAVVQGRVALAVLLVDVRAELEQQLRDAPVVVLARDVQKRVLGLVLDLAAKEVGWLMGWKLVTALALVVDHSPENRHSG